MFAPGAQRVAKSVVFTIPAETKSGDRRRVIVSPEAAVLRATLSRLKIVGSLQCRSWEFSCEDQEKDREEHLYVILYKYTYLSLYYNILDNIVNNYFL